MHQQHSVKTGLERLFKEEEYKRRLEGKRIGWLANATTIDRNYEHAIDRSLEEGLNVVRLFGPEHGLRGGAQDMVGVEDDRDPLTGIPTVSLYGHQEESLRPRTEDLDGLDVVLIDMQDIGTRYYTYAYTAAFMVQACHDAGVEAWVLDRPNPIAGEEVEGNLVTPEFTSFVGIYPIPNRHGMTLCELIRLLAAREGWSDALTLVPMDGWQRHMWYEDTGVPWVMPSPNMPTVDTAVVYPGQCLLEGTNLSEARGTTRPFELFGAPWLDAYALRAELQDMALPGVAWRTIVFEPTVRKFARQACHGLQIHVTNRNTFKPLKTSIAILQVIRSLHGADFRWREEAYEFVEDRLAIDLLLGDQVLRLAVEDGMPVDEIEQLMDEARAGFDEERREHLLYD